MSVLALGVLVCLTPLELHQYDSGHESLIPKYQQACAVIPFEMAEQLAGVFATNPQVKTIPNPYTSGAKQ